MINKTATFFMAVQITKGDPNDFQEPSMFNVKYNVLGTFTSFEEAWYEIVGHSATDHMPQDLNVFDEDNGTIDKHNEYPFIRWVILAD